MSHVVAICRMTVGPVVSLRRPLRDSRLPRPDLRRPRALDVGQHFIHQHTVERRPVAGVTGGRVLYPRVMRITNTSELGAQCRVSGRWAGVVENLGIDAARGAR